MGEQTLIKTTAKFQDNKEPIKQRPIIQFDSRMPHDATTHLPNTVRSSIESGRDNPFRPDGEIYKSADPIVDYYKFGPNQSRAHTPTDSQLLLNGQNEASKNKKKKKKKDRKKPDGEARRNKKSCWRKWLCCCCCCCKCFKCCRNETGDDANDIDNPKPGEGELHDRAQTVSASAPTAAVAVAAGAASKQEKQTKVVVLRDDEVSSVVNRPASYNINQSQPTIMLDGNNSKKKKKMEEEEKPDNEPSGIGSTTTNNKSTSRCVVS